MCIDVCVDVGVCGEGEGGVCVWGGGVGCVCVWRGVGCVSVGVGHVYIYIYRGTTACTVKPGN